jgi:hypothetical protein
MSTLIKTRRMPANYLVRAGGITEIRYNATPEVIVVLPGTRWLEHRREREARLLAEAAQMLAEAPASVEPSEPVIDTELANLDFATDEGIVPELPCLPDEMTEKESLSWTDRMRIATTKLIRRQNPWISSLRGAQADLEFSPQE